MTLLEKNMFINHIIILNHISSFHTLPNIPLKTKLKMKNLVHLFLAILYYLMVFSNGSGNNSTQNKQKL